MSQLLTRQQAHYACADVSGMLISDQEFKDWVARHQHVEASGIPLVPESNEQMRGTYAMMDARGRFFSNATGAHAYGPSLFDVGVGPAWRAVEGAFDVAGFEERGGAYEWADGARSAAYVWIDGAQARAGDLDAGARGANGRHTERCET